MIIPTPRRPSVCSGLVRGTTNHCTERLQRIRWASTRCVGSVLVSASGLEDPNRLQCNPTDFTSDPNREDDPEYIARLVGQVVRVSLETVKIVNNLPEQFS